MESAEQMIINTVNSFLYLKGSKNVKQEGECCGTCVPNMCKYTANNKTYHLQVLWKTFFVSCFSSPKKESAVFCSPCEICLSFVRMEKCLVTNVKTLPVVKLMAHL